MVAVDGKMKKSEYRTFRIKSKDSQDDYAAMAEAVGRRMAHVGKPGDSMSAAPDLILLDGGRGHVSVIRELMAREGYDVPVFGMVKDEHHKTRTLTDEDGEINIARQADLFRLIYGIQEEVHRYSVSRMMGAKRKTIRSSALEKIHGIGPAKAKALLGAFRSLTALKTAEKEAIAMVPGISSSDAEAVYRHFHPLTEAGSDEQSERTIS